MAVNDAEVLEIQKRNASKKYADIGNDRKAQIRDSIFAFKLLILKIKPKYGRFLLKIDTCEDYNISRVCTDGKKIYYNPLYFAAIGKEKYLFLILHEMFHIWGKHCFRLEGKKEEFWNTACEFEANERVMNLIFNYRLDIEPPEDAIGILEGCYCDHIQADEFYYEMLSTCKYGIGDQRIHFRYKWQKYKDYSISTYLADDLIYPHKNDDQKLSDEVAEIDQLIEWAEDLDTIKLYADCVFYHKAESFYTMSDEDQDKLKGLIEYAFSLESDEQTTLTLMALLAINRKVVKEAFAICDNEKIDSFLGKCYYLKD